MSCEIVLELTQESGFPGLIWCFGGLFAGSCRVVFSIPFLFWLFLERLTFLPHLSSFFCSSHFLFKGLPVRPVSSAGSGCSGPGHITFSLESVPWFIFPRLSAFGFFCFEDSLLGKIQLWAFNSQEVLLGSRESGFGIITSPWLSAAPLQAPGREGGPLAVGCVISVSDSQLLRLRLHPQNDTAERHDFRVFSTPGIL